MREDETIFSSKRSLVITLALLATLLGVGDGYMLYKTLVLDFKSPGTRPDDLVLIIPKNTSTRQICALLEKNSLVPSAFWAELSLRLRGLNTRLKAGEYDFKGADSPQILFEKMVRGNTVSHKITVPEGWTSSQVLKALQEEEKLAGPLPASLPEGSILPETYTFKREDTRASLLLQMKRAWTKASETLWSTRSPDHPLTSWENAVILASLVEKETRLASERPRVAAVFLNRLKRGMPLQADPTVAYALSQTDAPLTRADLAFKSPYNTYLHTGLPPTAICNPGVESLKAVLTPLETDDLFFVADGSGGHVFSSTYSEHQKNHIQWRKIRAKK
jgi:UPF0755 protein